ncbi:glycoside hydrolase family 38 protein [[Candida] arabinofermentans NRRL YB-2248]|uniref:Alpha-mannosidase n=1 Tax=[Candida] arabinofermentans NRRL YB-2248 TaxID=983967 RepID=A0A1E4T4A4_9ASCO|nr:glycoside hydrolase family 38 protein [[Candida] arabinofermentans NRRL YB-2248]
MGSKYPQLNNNPQFKPVDSIYEGRLRQFINTGGGYQGLMLPKFYVKRRFDNSKPATGSDEPNAGYIDLKHWPAPELTKPLFHEVIPDKLPDFKTVHKGDNFGPAWSSHWFQATVKIPDSWVDERHVLMNWDSGCEGMVFDEDGLPIQGLTGSSERTEFIIPPEWFGKGTGEFIFYIEIGCNGMFGSTQSSYRLDSADIFVPNYDARGLYYDFWIISDAARELNGPQKHKAREVANRIMDTFDEIDESTILKCREIAKEYLGDNIDSEKVFEEAKVNPSSNVYAVGNCHIDTAWLWDFATSKTKVARSWSSQIRLIERYPEYVFVASAAQHFKWLIDYYPDLFEKVKQFVMQGRFVPLGGSWVENDTNMPSGEGFVRQFLMGQRWFENMFGFKSDIYWLPDSFGYSSQVPQLCRLAEMPNFLTQKLSWNNINQFPNNTFNWVGIDSSQVLVHMPPDNTYTAPANFGDVKRSIQGHKNLYNDQKGLLLYGKGDGGGGPTDEMIEKLRRCRGLADTVGGEMPTVQMNCTISDFYHDIRKDTKNGATLPAWKGELYLEYHRGTYTSQAKVKNFMRTSEMLMRDLEFLATKASVELPDYNYPHAKIDRLWQDICLCQFHDVLPGSCIEKVYRDDVWPMLSKVIETEYKMIKEILSLFEISELQTDNEIKSDDNIVKFNSFPWKRFEIVKLESQVASDCALATQSGKYVAMESESDNTTSIMRPLVGIKSASDIKHPASIEKVNDDLYVLKNDKLKASINSNGVIVSLLDVINGREIIDSSRLKGGNQYVMFADTPLNFPAWDTELFSLGKYKNIDSATNIEIIENGPLLSALKVVHKLSATSEITTTISLEGLNDLSQKSMLKFDCHVEWHEIYKFLKVQFPVTINSETANYETQFGITKRPTHFNTSWDVAKFEVCSHKFMDYSDFNYGVTILNNNKYGGSVHGNTMTLSLLRAPKYPDGNADMGSHDFSYALMPHQGNLGVESVRAGWEFNDRIPGVYLQKKKIASSKSEELVSIVGDANLMLSNVKRGEDDDTAIDSDGMQLDDLPKKFKGHKTLVLRVYESLGGFSKATIKIGQPVKQVFKTNLLEEEKEEVKLLDGKNGFEIVSRGFEISTYKVILDKV